MAKCKALTGTAVKGLSHVRVLSSEDSQRRQRILRSRRHAAVRQVQVAEEVYEGVRCYANVFLRRFQSVAAQVLPAQ